MQARRGAGIDNASGDRRFPGRGPRADPAGRVPAEPRRADLDSRAAREEARQAFRPDGQDIPRAVDGAGANLAIERPAIVELEDLEPGSYLEPVLKWTNEQGGADVCWCGHSPDVERFVAALVSDGSARVRFAKGAVAAIEFDDEAAIGAGELCWLATAKSLGV